MDDTLPLFAFEAEIDAIHANHALWLASEGREGRRAHFQKSALTGLNMAGYRFADASLRHIIIRDVDLSRADLTGCDLTETTLENVDLRGAFLSGANLSGAELRNVTLEGADLRGATLLNVNIRDANLTGVNMSGAILQNADMQGIDFSHAQFTHAVLREANCAGSRFDYADLSRADCRDAVFDHASFAGAILQDAEFKGASLHSINVRDADFAAAREVTFDLQTQMLFEEKRLLMQERAALEDMGSRLNVEQKKLDTREETVCLHEKRFEFALPYMVWVVRASKIICMLWTILSIALLVLTVTRVAQLGMEKVTIIVAGVAVVLILSFLSLYFALKTRYILQNIASRDKPPAQNNIKK